MFMGTVVNLIFPSKQLLRPNLRNLSRGLNSLNSVSGILKLRKYAPLSKRNKMGEKLFLVKYTSCRNKCDQIQIPMLQQML